jgi:protein tyrosine phosphatase
MGADQSSIKSKAGDQYANLPKLEKRAMASAEKARGRRLSMKAKTKTDFLGDVTAYPDKQYTLKELETIEKNLAKRLTKISTDIDKMTANKYKLFIKNYTEIKDGLSEAKVASQLPGHKHLNRYNNILAYDSSRVKVAQPNADTHNTDYINANYIHGHGRANMYIASQGPVPDSQAAFWQMLWEQNVQMIVMVTGEVEGGKLKCHRYWPKDTQEALAFGGYSIQMSEVEAFPTYIARCFQLTKRATGESRIVFHYQYIAWPDHGVPDTAIEMLRFRAVVKEKFDANAGPMTVHCSAGVGRTGTFIGLDRYLDSCADLDDTMTVLDIVKDMRKSRNFMVQAQAQFIYLYEAAKEGLSKLLDKVRRELRFAGFNPGQMQEAMLKEIDVDLTAEMQDVMLRNTMGGGGKVDVRHSDGSKYTDDRGEASKVPPQNRINSLANSTDVWLQRNNVPMDPNAHGYRVQAAGLETRLSALSESRTKWMKVYSEAEKTWASAQDEEGVQYDVGHQLTTIESRVQSLANAEAAWTIAGNGQNNIYDEMAAENLANLELRLQSLSYTVLTAEQRWKDRGTGFRGPAANKESIQAALKASNAKYAGSLTDRLQSLQGEQTAWKARSGSNPYDKEKFFKEIGEEYEKQEQQSAQNAAEVAALQKAMEATAVEKKQMELEEVARAADDTAAKKSRDKAKRVAQAASVANEGEYLPHTVQMNKAKVKAAKEAKKLAASEEKKEKARLMEAAKAQELATKKQAKALSSKYLNNLKGK